MIVVVVVVVVVVAVIVVVVVVVLAVLVVSVSYLFCFYLKLISIYCKAIFGQLWRVEVVTITSGGALLLTHKALRCR